jgi:hypothetical protein
MKKSLIYLVFLVVFFSGCNNGNFSPRLKQNNSNSSGEISNNQNGFMLELGKIKKETEILGSKLREIQEGLVNLNAAVSRNENTGVQILQGDGSLILVFALSVVALLFYYKSKNSQEVAKILTQKIVDAQDTQLMNSVVKELSEKKKDKEFLSVLRKIM